MDKTVKKILSKIEKNGFEAYIVGGYVRDLFLKKTTYDIDICTNALPKDLKKIFPNSSVTQYGNVFFKVKKYDIEITTYRKEFDYCNRRPKKIEYINNLIDDLNRRDFTINALCMNQKGIMIDLIDGYNDLQNKVIRVIGDPLVKLREDPLRILRAIRFATVLNFSLEDSLVDAIHKTNKEILMLSKTRVKEELDKILISENAINGLKLLNEFKILNLLGISYKKIVKVYDLIGMWSQLELKGDFPFTKGDRNNIIKIKRIIEKGIIDKTILFNNGLYLSNVAGSILGVDNITINKLYKSMPIYSLNDLAVSALDIKKFLKIEDGPKIGEIIEALAVKVLNDDLKNNKKCIYNYLSYLKED